MADSNPSSAPLGAPSAPWRRPGTGTLPPLPPHAAISDRPPMSAHSDLRAPGASLLPGRPAVRSSHLHSSAELFTDALAHFRASTRMVQPTHACPYRFAATADDRDGAAHSNAHSVSELLPSPDSEANFQAWAQQLEARVQAKGLHL